MRIILAQLFILTGCFVFQACAEHTTVLYHENFDKIPDGTIPENWWTEGSKAVGVYKGKLFIDANRDSSGEDLNAATVWLNKQFDGNLKIEYDALVVRSIGDMNNINFFLFFSDSTGVPLYESRKIRTDGKYKGYHSSSLNGYIFTYLAGGSPEHARFRLRDCPGFHLLYENKAYECRRNKIYHIEIMKFGNKLIQKVDGTIYTDFIDNIFNEEHKSGLIGFRTWSTELWVDNFKISALDHVED